MEVTAASGNCGTSAAGGQTSPIVLTYKMPIEHHISFLVHCSNMPLVKIDLVKSQRKPEELRKLADVVQRVLTDTFAAPQRDRYQIM